MSTAKERLKLFIDRQGISLQEFYDATGLKRGLLDTDKLHQAISSDRLAIISECYPTINIAWVITGEGAMLRQESSKKYSLNQQDSVSIVSEPTDLSQKQRTKQNNKGDGSISNFIGGDNNVLAPQAINSIVDISTKELINDKSIMIEHLMDEIKSLNSIIEEKEKRIKEKDERIKEKDERIAELTNRLLECLKG